MPLCTLHCAQSGRFLVDRHEISSLDKFGNHGSSLVDVDEKALKGRYGTVRLC